MLNRVPYLDYDGARCAYWPAYRRAFNMLNEWRLMSRGGWVIGLRGGVDGQSVDHRDDDQRERSSEHAGAKEE
jgi:hypothetical protein